VLAPKVIGEIPADLAIQMERWPREVRMEGDDDTSTYLVGSIEEKGRGYDVISPGSPLGKALLGHAPGEKVIYEAPGGRFEVEILTVRPPD